MDFFLFICYNFILIVRMEDKVMLFKNINILDENLEVKEKSTLV